MARKAGRGDPIITKEKLQKYLGGLSPPLAGTTQIADHFDVRRPSAIERLDTFEDEGIVGKREVGQSFAWYLMDWKVVVEADSGGGYGGYQSEPETEPEQSSEAMQAKHLGSGIPSLIAFMRSPLSPDTRLPVWFYAWTIAFGISPILIGVGPSSQGMAWFTLAVVGFVAVGFAIMIISIFVGISRFVDELVERLDDTPGELTGVDR